VTVEGVEMNKQIFVSIAESLQWVDDIVVFVWAY